MESTIQTFHHAGQDFTKCKKILVCDGYKNKETAGNKGTPKSLMRVGIVNDAQRANYEAFKVLLAKKVEEQADSPGKEFWNTELVVLPSRHGYGFALKEALKLVVTKYVCVIQHDRTFLRRTPVRQVVAAMERYPEVKYVGMLMRSNLLYLEQFLGKYGKKWAEEHGGMILKPEDLRLPKEEYSGDGVAEKLAAEHAGCGERYVGLRTNYLGSVSYQKHLGVRGTMDLYPASEALEEERKEADFQGSLIPTLFWYDNVHVVLTEHYRDFVFDPALQLVAKGGFVEDKLSPAMVTGCKTKGLKEGFDKFGCYLLDDHLGMAFTGHSDGGNFMTQEQRVEAVAGYMKEANISEGVVKEAKGAMEAEEGDFSFLE